MTENLTIVCKEEPKGAYGLNGFALSGIYAAQKIENEGGDGHYYKVSSARGVESCSKKVFDKFFDIL